MPVLCLYVAFMTVHLLYFIEDAGQFAKVAICVLQQITFAVGFSSEPSLPGDFEKHGDGDDTCFLLNLTL